MFRLRPSLHNHARGARLRVFAVVAVALVVLTRWTPLRLQLGGKTPVCLVGNAETSEGALSVYNQWSGAFPTTFYVWGEESDGPRQVEGGRVVLLSPADKTTSLPFADGMFAAVQEITRRQRCEYIFTHDDDLKYHLAPLSKRYNAAAPTDGIADELVDLLLRYRPAVAGFPWAVGDERFEGMKALKKLYENEEVAPLTGFDNGMVVYHISVLNFFFPFSPQGEGGFVGKWTLGAHFLQMFAPSIFREHAIRLNTLPYDNALNMDNVPKEQLKSIKISNNLAYVPTSRHPYEYPLNEAYISFLKSGLKNRDQPWGRYLGVDDVAVPEPYTASSYSHDWILQRLDEFYDIRHEALKNTRFMQATPPTQLATLAASSSTPYSFRVILFTKNRLSSFQRCWESVTAAYPLPADVPVDVVVYVDYDPLMTDEVRAEYEAYLDQIKQHHGPASSVQIVKQTQPIGLRTSILSSWHPSSNHEYAIFLEDDIEVSPYFLQYAQKSIEAYVYRDHGGHRLFGISLYNLRYNEAIEAFVSVENNNQPYIYQQPQSWGAIYAPEPWRRFKTWFHAFPTTQDPLVPDSMTNRWPFATSWKKYYIRFMVEMGGYMIYPNLPEGKSYSTNHVEVGTNDKASQLAAQKIIHGKFRVPLLLRSDDFSLQMFPPLSSLDVYTLQHEKIAGIDAIPHGVEHVTSFDKCTLMLTVYSRTTTFTERLDYYQHLDKVGQIVVVWNNLNVPPPQTVFTNYSVPVLVVPQKRNSLNNRFFPHEGIQYSCIINMDDDWDMPYEHLQYAVDTWKGHFFNHLVGFTHQGRNYVRREVDGEDVSLYSSTFLSPQLLFGKKAFYSIVLPSGYVYHRKFLHEYTYDVPQEARDLVDELMNCEDVLVNFAFANRTGHGPVLINAWAKMIGDLGSTGLFARPSHMGARTSCIRRLEEIYGGNPLKYTTSLFPIQHNTVPPGLHHYTYSDTIPFDYPCSRSEYERAGYCSMVMEKETWDHAGGWV
ncbi:hypothetical protein JCM8547_000166 [Rhodosporidiobolus lusitaniae]